jgi:hypothetical protein
LGIYISINQSKKTNQNNGFQTKVHRHFDIHKFS